MQPYTASVGSLSTDADKFFTRLKPARSAVAVGMSQPSVVKDH